jgi:hypothetical protein
MRWEASRKLVPTHSKHVHLEKYRAIRIRFTLSVLHVLGDKNFHHLFPRKPFLFDIILSQCFQGGLEIKEYFDSIHQR